MKHKIASILDDLVGKVKILWEARTQQQLTALRARMDNLEQWQTWMRSQLNELQSVKDAGDLPAEEAAALNRLSVALTDRGVSVNGRVLRECLESAGFFQAKDPDGPAPHPLCGYCREVGI